MSLFRRIVATLLAVGVAAFSLISSAASTDKVYNLSIANDPSAPISTSRIFVTFFNAIPNGNSSFNSLQFTITTTSGSAAVSTVAPSATGSLTTSTSGNTTTVTIQNLYPIKPQQSVTFTVTFTGIPCGSQSGISVDARDSSGASTVFTGSNLTGQTFTASNTLPATFTLTSNCEGTLACGGLMPSSSSNPASSPSLTSSDPGYAFAQRGFYNAKGDLCNAVDYNFTNSLLVTGDNSVTHKWNLAQAQSAAFYYTLNGPADSLAATNVTPTLSPPVVAWEFNAGGNPINTTNALVCLSAMLPQPYGVIKTGYDLNGTDATSTVVLDLTTSIPTTKPIIFGQQAGSPGWAPPPGIGQSMPLYIGSERMSATVVSNDGSTLTLTATRGTGMTTKSTHAAGAYALSTPLPIDTRCSSPASPYCGKAVQMCAVAQGWQGYGPTQYFQTVDIIDIGDGYVRAP